MAIKIERIEEGSEAQSLGLQPGDELLSVDDNELNDTLDYDFYTDSKSFHLKARVADGIREWDVQRAERGPFGCDFSTYLGDQKHSCSNHCMFCFIDQLPPGMRESLYFKDDDERLSFLFGNYITMTNMQDHEIDRIIKMHISPINISVHTTNPQLRVRMLANKRAGEVLKYLPRLVEGGIAVNCQLVLCRGINDGDELRRTLSDLLELTPMVQSIAAVPCGVTDYRKNLFKQTPYDAETSAAVIDIMEEQKNISNMGGTMRLGAYECVLRQGSRAFNIYKKEHIQERHRHRYEFNNEFQKEFEKLLAADVGKALDQHTLAKLIQAAVQGDLVEVVEIPGLKWYIGTQYHPEYQSTVLKPHPLFVDFVKTAIANKK